MRISLRWDRIHTHRAWPLCDCLGLGRSGPAKKPHLPTDRRFWGPGRADRGGPGTPLLVFRPPVTVVTGIAGRFGERGQRENSWFLLAKEVAGYEHHDAAQ